MGMMLSRILGTPMLVVRLGVYSPPTVAFTCGRRADFAHDIGLDAAHIGHDTAIGQSGTYLVNQRAHDADGRRQHNQFGVRNGLDRIIRRLIRGAELIGLICGVGPARPNDDAFGDLAVSGCKANGTPKEAGTEDGKFTKHRRSL